MLLLILLTESQYLIPLDPTSHEHWFHVRPDATVGSLAGAGDAVCADTLLTPLRAAVAYFTLEREPFAQLLTRLAEDGALHAGVVLEIGKHLDARYGDRNALLALEAFLRRHPNSLLRWLGLTTLQKAATSSVGWTQTMRERLVAYQADPDPLVASAAQFIFPPDTDMT